MFFLDNQRKANLLPDALYNLTQLLFAECCRRCESRARKRNCLDIRGNSIFLFHCQCLRLGETVFISRARNIFHACKKVSCCEWRVSLFSNF